MLREFGICFLFVSLYLVFLIILTLDYQQKEDYEKNIRFPTI